MIDAIEQAYMIGMFLYLAFITFMFFIVALTSDSIISKVYNQEQAIKDKCREYLKHPSVDGTRERHILRKELEELVNDKT